ncbi:hypothetical protein pdam_00008625 [Pocillopora damicornis]|uniref:Uncharacterized protein n=1 Tax=Pocillopora damicornis TaxID=46731 RepID=A0A3M6U806_POCDA|nr:hypothetical protein pdam_00008625 [Pocillopora damicornis]
MTRSGGVTTLSAKYYSIFSSLLSTRKLCSKLVSDQGEAHQVRWKYALVDLGRHYPSNRPSTLTSPRIRRTCVTLYQRP